MVPPDLLPLGLALGLAWLIDARWGEPPNAWHPVAWLGRVLGPLGRGLKARPPLVAGAGGALAWLLLAAALTALSAWLQWWILSLPWWLAAPLLALVLKPLFAWRMLRDEVAAVGAALYRGLEPGRQRLTRLVSRDVRQLDAVQVRESAIETLAENLNDSVIAPLAWFALLGLPGAVLYRFANTADAMWGYRGEWEWAGKWAARADDVLSWPTARLSAVLLWPQMRLSELGELWRQARLTPSPNGGWPMGAMAMRLGVRLSKPGVYVLNAQGREADSADLQGALLLAGLAAQLWAAAAVGVLLLVGAFVQIPAASPPWGEAGWYLPGLAVTLLTQWVSAWTGA